MKTLRLPFASLLLGLVLPAQAMLPPRVVEDVLPASSYACFRFGGLDACAHSADQLGMAALVQDLLSRLPAELVQQHLDGNLEQAAQRVRAHLEQAGMTPAMVRAVLGRPMAIGMGRITLNGMGPSLALVVDAGEAMPTVQKWWTAVEQLAGDHLGYAARGAEFEGVPVRALSRAGSPSVYAGSMDGWFVITNSPAYAREIRATAQGRQPSLAQASSLAAARQALPEPALASLFLHTQPLLSMFDAHLPYQAPQWGRALGVDGLSGVYLGAGPAGSGGAETVHLGLTGDHRGLCKAAFAGAASLAAAKWCSQDTVLFGSLSLDVPAAVQAFDAVLEALPAPVRAEARRDIARDLGRDLQRGLGIEPKELHQLLQAAGHQVSIAVNLAKGPMPLPEVLLFAEVQDWSKIEPRLQQLMAMAGEHAQIEWKVRKAGEVDIHYFDLQLPEGPALSPCWLHKDGMLAIGSSVKALLSALRQAESPDGSLEATPDFAALQATAGAAGVLQVRFGHAAELGYKAGAQPLGALLESQRQELGFGKELLPDADTLAKALGTCTLSLRVDDRGITLRHQGNLGLAAILAGVGRGVVEVLDRATAKVY